MKAKLAIVTAASFGFSLAVHVPKVRAEKPPVDVQALDDEEEDFFNEKPAKKKAEEKKAQRAEDDDEDEAPKKKVKKHSGSDEDDLFDELDAMEKGVKIKKKRHHADNENTNQQVVNVVVVGEKDTKSIAGTKASSENDATNEAKQLQKQQQKEEQTVPLTGQTPPGQKARTTRETVPQSAAISRPNATTSIPQPSHTWNDWWNRDNHLEAGDVLFFWQVGGYGGVVNQGLGLEGMFSDWTGLRFSVNGSFADHPDFDADGFDRLHNEGIGTFGAPSGRGYGFFNGGSHVASQGSVSSAFTHLEDLSLTFHFGHRSHGLDLFPSIGLSHFGYDLRTSVGEEKGGAGFLKLAVGANWFYKRFFLGAELGWYPAEIFKYGVAPGANGHGDVQFMDIGKDEAWDKNRIRFTAHLGMNF